MGWASGEVTAAALLRAWSIALVSNALGACGLALLVSATGYAQMNEGAVGLAAVKIAAGKTALSFWPAFFGGVLCNVLVCLAVWLTMAARSVTDKILAVVFPISAFVAAGFEHSVANMYFIPLGILLRDSVDPAGIADIAALTWSGYLHNLVPVTLGNIVGGSGLVALVYWMIYKRPPKTKPIAQKAPAPN
jgi:formate transporter